MPSLGKVSGSRSVVVEVTPQRRRKVSIHPGVLEVRSKSNEFKVNVEVARVWWRP